MYRNVRLFDNIFVLELTLNYIYYFVLGVFIIKHILIDLLFFDNFIVNNQLLAYSVFYELIIIICYI